MPKKNSSFVVIGAAGRNIVLTQTSAPDAQTALNNARKEWDSPAWVPLYVGLGRIGDNLIKEIT